MSTLSYPKDKIKIVLLENIHESVLKTFHANGYTHVESLSTSLEGDELIHKLQDAHMVGIRSHTQITKEVLDQAARLMVIGCFCIGTNQVNLQAAAQKGIPVFNAPHSNARSVAELVIGLIIMLMRDIFHKSQSAHQGLWLKNAKGCHEVRGKNLGIIGYGNIGSQISVLAENLGMNVFYYDIQPKLSLGNAHHVKELDELLSISDIITLHVPETPSTKNLMNKDRINKIKKGSFLINTSRGSVVDIEALAERLKNKEIRGAALDVFPKEPKNNSTPFESPLRGIENVILTPHIAGSTMEAQENIALNVGQKLVDFFDRGTTDGATNFPNLSLAPQEKTHRVLHTHQNIPGILKQINQAIADEEINILSQYLKTNEEIGYIVLDIDQGASEPLLKVLKTIPGTIKVRVLY